MDAPDHHQLARSDNTELTPRQPLFRPQVIAEQQTQWLGTVLIKPRSSHRLMTLLSVAAAAGIVALLFSASYAKKAQVKGWLVPEQGIVRVYAAQPGIATRLFVKEGEEVRKGQALLVLSTEQQSVALGDTQANVARSMAVRRDSLIAEKRQNQQLLKQQVKSLSERIAAIRTEEEQIKEEIGLQQTRMQMAMKSEQRQRELVARGFISEQQLQVVAEARLEQVARLRALERNRITIRRERLALEGELSDLPLKSDAQTADIERNIAIIGQELAEAEARREIIVPAPQNGRVTSIQAEIGGGVKSAVPLLSIVPAGSALEAHLYATSRAMGFVRPGQQVLLRYQAYPYQKFGHYQGVVTTISGSAITPAELPAQLSGLTSLLGGPEPIYRITVRLARQDISAYGKPARLEPGMQLEADIVIERRRLIEWVLDPIYSFSGKWNG